ncbi:hypothetical protein SDC9_202989 [bioreactor metagenome]|uniref:Uncharacterized protein n=1 Tax=bioreactor metagenome TaxID=1076179 RepID=A0A645IVZ8_9ZZZZ
MPVVRAFVVRLFDFVPRHAVGQPVPPVGRIQRLFKDGRENIKTKLSGLGAILHIVAVLTVKLLFLLQKNKKYVYYYVKYQSFDRIQ